MGRPPVIPSEKKIRIVLSILAGEMSLAEAARREKVSEQSIGRWKAEFLEGGNAALVAGKTGPSSREEQLEAEVAELTGFEVLLDDRRARANLAALASQGSS
jgi:transposase